MAAFFLAGLVFLTKMEVFVALSATLLCGGVVYFKTQSTGKLKATQILFTALAIASIPPMLFWIYFSFHMPWSQAMASLVSPWLLSQTSSLHAVPLYQWIIGTDAIGENLLKMLSCFFLYLLILVPLIALNRWLPRWTAHLKLYSLLTVISILVLFFIVQDRIPWPDLLRPLPLIMVSLAVVSLMFLMKGNLDTADRGHYFALLVLSLFSFALLLKMILNTHLFHYGFALAMPATLILIWILLYAIPNHKPLFTGPSTLYRNAMLVLIIVFIGKHVGLSYTMFNLKDYPVGTERGVLLDFGPEIDSRASLTHEAIQYINGKLPSHSDLATLPYGNMINYMTGHPNPLRHHTFNPGHALLFGEKNYLANLKAISPAHILLVDRDFAPFGRRFFGRDYARQIYSWIVQNYEVQKQFGEIPFSGRGFGIQILRRKDIRN